MTLQPRQLILEGKYRVEELIGTGAFGEVYRATHLQLNVPRAIKVLRSDAPGIGSTEFTDYRKRFQLEFQIAARFDHPNIIKVYDLAEEAGVLYAVLEYAPCRSVKDLIEQVRCVPADQTVQILLGCAAGLDALHEEDIIHRDVKPANILIGKDGQAKIADLGLAQVAGGEVSQRSMLGSVAPLHPGTPNYRSPEHNSPESLAPTSDIYSLGCVAFEMLTGKPWKVVMRRVRTVRELCPEVPDRLDEVVTRMLCAAPGLTLDDADDSRKRYVTMTQFADALKRAREKISERLEEEAREREAERVAQEKVERERRETEEQARAERQAREQLEEEARKREAEWVAQEQVERERRETEEQARVERLAREKISEQLEEEARKREAEWVAQEQVERERRETGEQARVEREQIKREELLLTPATGVTLELVRVPAGEFLMGSADTKWNWLVDRKEKPLHEVALGEYWISRYEVTNSQYDAFARASERSFTIPTGKENHPVVKVSWDDAVAFCAWASQATGHKVRLPSEAQWEKAARGMDGKRYPWGKDVPDPSRLNYSRNVGGTTPVGKYSPQGDSPYGVSDMAGNVWEWTSSLYKPYPYNADDGREDPQSRDVRVVRGGSWNFNQVFTRAAARYGHYPHIRGSNIGFRVVSTLE